MARRSLKYLLNRYTLSFRNRIVVIAVGMVICLLSLVYTCLLYTSDAADEL